MCYSFMGAPVLPGSGVFSKQSKTNVIVLLSERTFNYYLGAAELKANSISPHRLNVVT